VYGLPGEEVDRQGRKQGRRAPSALRKNGDSLSLL
jgi:hypothetical protein